MIELQVDGQSACFVAKAYLDRLEQERKELREENKRHCMSYDLCDACRLHYLKQVRQLEVIVRALSEQVQDKDDDITQLTNQLQEAKGRVQKLEAQLMQTSELLESKCDLLIRRDQQLDEQLRELGKRGQRIQELEALAQQREDERNSLRQDNERLQRQRDMVQHQFDVQAPQWLKLLRVLKEAGCPMPEGTSPVESAEKWLKNLRSSIQDLEQDNACLYAARDHYHKERVILQETEQRQRDRANTLADALRTVYETAGTCLLQQKMISVLALS